MKKLFFRVITLFVAARDVSCFRFFVPLFEQKRRVTLRTRTRKRLILQGRRAIRIAAATVKGTSEFAPALNEFAAAPLIRACDARAGQAERLREFAFRIVGAGEKRAASPLPFEKIRAALLALLLRHARRGLNDRFAVFAFGDLFRSFALGITAARQK